MTHHNEPNEEEERDENNDEPENSHDPTCHDRTSDGVLPQTEDECDDLNRDKCYIVLERKGQVLVMLTFATAKPILTQPQTPATIR